MTRDERVAIGIVALTAVVKLAFASRFDLLADEAYYAMWSEHLAWGYYDQPPLIAAVLALVRLGGDHDVLIRLPAVLAGVFGVWVLWRHTKDRLFWAAWWTGLPPLAWLTGFATPDAFLLAAWAGALASAAVGGPAWLLVGAFALLAGLSKYTGLLLFPLCWWAVRDRSPWVLGGLLVLLIGLSPHGWWLVQHDFVSVRFQLSEGLTSPHAPGIWGPVQVALQQLGVLTPLGLLAVLLGSRYVPSDRVGRLAWFTSVPVMGLFLIASVGGPPEAHWLAPAWIGAGVLLSRASGRLARVAWAAVGCGGFASLVLLVHAEVGVFRLPLDPADRVREGRVLGEAVGVWALPVGVGPREPRAREGLVRTERYQEAALIWWYTGIPAARARECGRRDQFDLWDLPAPSTFVFVRPARSGPLTCTGPVKARHPLIGQPLEGEVVGRWDLFEIGP